MNSTNIIYTIKNIKDNHVPFRYLNFKEQEKMYQVLKTENTDLKYDDIVNTPMVILEDNTILWNNGKTPYPKYHNEQRRLLVKIDNHFNIYFKDFAQYEY